MRVQSLGSPKVSTSQKLSLYLSRVRAGFPSPADDYVERLLDLNEHLVKHPAATVLVRAEGDSMKGRGIFSGDILIVDRSVKPCHGNIVIAALGGELTCKIYDAQLPALVSANKNFLPIPLDENSDLIIEGVVVHSIRNHL